MLVVSNTSPIVNLAGIHHLSLLSTFFDQIIIPDAVYDEIVVKGAGQPGAVEVVADPRFVRRSIGNPLAVQALSQRTGLDQGEAEVIVLAQELGASLVLLDERLARNVASLHGIPFRGVLGLLLDAKRGGVLTQVTPLLDQLIQFGFFIDAKTYHDVRQLAGE